MSEIINPYVGPRAFDTGEVLYGRDREVRALKALLIAERIVLLHSPSGAGKTSLVRAGLLPQMREENFTILPVVRVNVEPPAEANGSNRYLFSTMFTMEEAFPEAERLPIEKLASLSLDAYLDLRATQDDTLLIFDQFEEILTASPADRDGKFAFFAGVGEALRNKKRWALFSMREDFLGALAPYLRPIPNRLVTRFRLDLLATEAAREAVQKPARTAGVNFSQEAAQKLVDDLRRIQVQQPDGTFETQLGPYVEPVQLQVVCYRLWEKKDPQEVDITIKDLENVGDVNESLAGYYALTVSRAAENSAISERSIRDWFEHKLITPDGIRGQVRMGAEMSDGLPNNAVRLLENAHIIRAEQRAGQTWFELAHDRLIEPVRSDNERWFERNLSLFQRQASLWLERGRGEGLLLRGRELDVAEQEVTQIEPTADELAFLQACRLRRKREQRDVTQRRWIMFGLIVSLAMFFVAVFFSLQAYSYNAQLQSAVGVANAASTRAIELQITAQMASTQAVDNALQAYAASTQAYDAKAAAEKSRNEAINNANLAATAQARAVVEKAKANQQEQIAHNQSLLAQANALVSQSLLAETRLDESLSTLMAAAAFQVADETSTRSQLLVPLANKNMLYMDQTVQTGQTIDLYFALGGTRLVTSNFYNCPQNDYFICTGIVKIWNITDTTSPTGMADALLRQQNGQIRPPGLLDASAVSPDGATIVTASCNPQDNNIVRCEEENLLFWDAATLKQSQNTLKVTGTIFNEQAVHLLYSPDGSRLVFSYNNPTIFNSSTTTGSTLVIWDTASYKEVGRLQTPGGVTQMAFNQDGSILAYVSGKRLVLIHMDTLEKQEILSPADSASALLSLAFSPDGKLLALGGENGFINLLDAKTYGKAAPPLVQVSKVLALKFSPDGKVLVAGHFDATIIYWDVESGRPLVKKPLFNHIAQSQDDFPIYSLAFSPDGRRLASSSNEIILWDMNPRSWFAKSCQIAGRNFTQAEWEQNFPGEGYRIICKAWPAGK